MVTTLTIFGATDKRVVTYPLLKVLMHLGRVLIVTDDALYRRFDGEYGTNFEFENSEFIVVPKVDDSVIEMVKQKQGVFEYVVYITTNEVPQSDKVVCVRGINKGLPSLSVQEQLEKIENSQYIEALFTFEKVEDKKALKITPSIKHYEYVTLCEDRKEFLESKDVAFSSLITTFFSEQLGLDKTKIKTVLGKEG